MAKTETVRIRMEPALKAEGEDILSALGLGTTRGRYPVFPANRDAARLALRGQDPE